MKNIFSIGRIWSMLVLLSAIAFGIQSCHKSKTDVEEVGTETVNVKTGVSSRSLINFDDVLPPATLSGETLDTIFTVNYGSGLDCMYVVSTGILDVSNLLYNNTCSMHADTLALGFVQNDTFRVRVPKAWMMCLTSQVPGQVWDVTGNY